MSKNTMITVIVASVAFALAAIIVGTSALVHHHGTERYTTCVEAGKSYVKVPEVDYYQCVAE